MPNFLNTVLETAKSQLAALMVTVKNLFTNTPEPARQTVISTILLILLLWAVLKIVKKATK